MITLTHGSNDFERGITIAIAVFSINTQKDFAIGIGPLSKYRYPFF